ncbi:MAG: hypothetical protein JSR24_09515 [Proteobacteria bacterium]|nr:hypothetical protein [Pseudomonadota bacterium]
MMIDGRRVVIGAVALPFLLGTSVSAEAPKEDVSVYSDLCYSPSSGDVNRDRLMLIHAFGQYYVVFQSGGGVLQPPVMVNAKVVGDDFSFELRPDSGRPVTFTGTIQPQEIFGIFSGVRAEETIRLPRRSLDDYPKLPPC